MGGSAYAARGKPSARAPQAAPPMEASPDQVAPPAVSGARQPLPAASPGSPGYDVSTVPVSASGRALPSGLRRKMEQALRADFSNVRVHEGRHVSRLDADAVTQGNSLHFAPGAFRPDTSEGQSLLGHELAHVVQQRSGRVRPMRRMEGFQVNDDAGLEREADTLGARALQGSALLDGPAPLPAAQASWRPAAMVAQRGKKKKKQVRPPKNVLALPPNPFKGKRPDKPKALTGHKDSRGNSLTAHHKLPYNQIIAEANAAIGGNQATHGNLEQWAQRGTSDQIGIGGLAWTQHNVFLGPLPEHRSDDPKEKLDTHFTQSGTVTPKSELALEIEASGGLGKIDPQELQKKLAALQDLDFSGYESDEWEDDGTGKRRQKGMPQDWQQLSHQDRLKYAKNKKAPKTP
ncbi:DUF4157 domain-containing protein [Corallococcus aberystwythensis]|uniref:DUF4157 domain-containing protein n=1 Tax=Corallococcus aberystwythensis TaxID=2316722 RepID=A0A3A8PHY5_9BACT|nr:DUF4157 domain-containing protein [Corallococcus aberystwythensis]RKH54930.1 DUF4157 domain-containing protein [Corallococcus aberystwythensis]